MANVFEGTRKFQKITGSVNEPKWNGPGTGQVSEHIIGVFSRISV